MSNFKSLNLFRKSQQPTILNSDQKLKLINKIESKREENEVKAVKEVKEIKASKTPEKPAPQKQKTSFFGGGGGGGGSGFFARSSQIDVKKEPLGSSYDDRKRIIFGKIDFHKEQNFISQFLLKSQKKINNEYVKMSSGSSFFMDVPLKVYNFALGLKENIANFCLIIRLYLIYDKMEKAYEIYLLMCKQNKKLVEFVYSKLDSYCKKASPAMLRFTPTISKIFILILSCFIKLSGKFCKTTNQNFFTILYIKTVYMITLTGINKVNLNDLKYYRLYLYSNCLFYCSIFNFYRFQSLSFSTNILQHIIELYQEKNPKEHTKFEQTLMLKVNYNLGLFYYIDGMNNEAINSLLQAKKILSEIVLYSSRNEDRESGNEVGRNSAILENREKHILNKLTFFKDKLNDLDEKDLNNIIIHKFEKKSSNENKGLKTINEESTKELPKKQFISDMKYSNSLFLGIKRQELKQPLLFDHIKRKIFNEIEFLLCQIELNKKNYRGALEHINIILNKEKLKDDFEGDTITKKKTFNMINKTFKNLKSFQGLRVKKLSGISKKDLVKVEENSKNKNNNENNILNNEEIILTENDTKLLKLLLEKIEHEYTEQLQLKNNNASSLNKRKDYLTFSPIKTKNMNYTNFKEMEKFFIFICSLSIFQLKILNETQPKLSSKRNDLPIIFSNQFQDCLTNSQRLTLTQLETMNLTRYIILIDSEKEISPENLDYKYMKHKIKTNNDNNDEEEIFKIAEDKGRTINSRKSNDSCMNSLSTNNNNPLSIRRFNKKEIEFEDENCLFDILLIKIKNEKNKDFIESHKKCILQILNNLNREDKELFQKSPNLLKNMLKKIEKKLKKDNINIPENYNIEESSNLNNLSISLVKSQ